MKTTEIFIEQVLVGSIVLAIAVLPLYAEIPCRWPTIECTKLTFVGGVAGGAVLLGLVYLVGMVFDRLADTILETWERHMRLRFAFKATTGWPRPWRDPFPEGKYKTRILIQGGAVSEWIEYLRTRIRLARSLAIFLPGLTVALQAALLHFDCKADCGGMSCDPWLGIVLLAGYMVLPSIQWCLSRSKSLSEMSKGIWKPPKTNDDEKEVCNYARARGLVNQDGPSAGWTFLDVCLGPPFVLFAVLLCYSGFIAAKDSWLLWITISGFGLTILSAWAWSRIVNTYMIYLEQLGRALDTQETKRQ